MWISEDAPWLQGAWRQLERGSHELAIMQTRGSKNLTSDDGGQHGRGGE